MYWRLSVLEGAEGGKGAPRTEGRFVLHRHRDGEGPHLDLRLEQSGYCCGWRVDAEALEDTALATEKGPHPADWLERDGSAERLDAGTYAWEWRDGGAGVLRLRGRRGTTRLSVARAALLPAGVVGAVAEALACVGADAAQAARLVKDGQRARDRAVARFCGLGRVVDGAGFDEGLWRETLAGRPLEEVERHLAVYEARFDEKHPPVSVSRPEPLGEDGTAGGERTLAILGSG